MIFYNVLKRYYIKQQEISAFDGKLFVFEEIYDSYNEYSMKNVTLL